MDDVVVTQADRERMASIEPIGLERDQILRGKRNKSPLLHAFARHRIESQRPLIEALEAIIWRSNNDQIGTGKVIDMREIALAATQQAKGE